MEEFLERGHIDKVVTTDNAVIPKYYEKVESHGSLQEVIETSKVTKEIAEILAPLETGPQFILIEGAPGIGKSSLLKEIACRWGKREILCKFTLVLLVSLRNPAVPQISLLKELFELFCKGDEEATKIASTSSKYFLKGNSKELALLLDGYDEMLKKDGLIADILKREVLPQCSLIISSRPHASVSLRKQATVKIDIWGFTEAEREHYIKESMKDQSQKIDDLTHYLQDHSTISSLCFIPFNIAVLVYLYKQEITLPKNSAELYNCFICLTVCRHLAKRGHDLQSSIMELTQIPKLSDLPEPYNRIIHQLSKLSLEALNDNKLIFTIDEIKIACPDIATTPEAINGFGLLQAVEHFGLIGKTTTFNFLHLSIQEYLAAHHLISLPADKELTFIEENFWSDVHFNMVSIYITLTKGQRSAFKLFLSEGNQLVTISDKFIYDNLQCFRLYRSFHEAGDVNICNTIEQSKKYDINVSGITLTATDVECVTVFLTSSFQRKWVMLDLSNCNIQDHGLHILYHGLRNYSDITVDELWLSNNGLTEKSSSLISEITIRCQVKKLWISANHTIGEDKQLYSMLTDSSTVLQELSMINTNLSPKAAIHLFKALKDNTKLKELYIKSNNIDDLACDAIITALENNSCLVQLFMHGNPLSSEAITKLVSGLKNNNTLAVIGLPGFPQEIEKKVISLQKAFNKNRENRGCQISLCLYYFK